MASDFSLSFFNKEYDESMSLKETFSPKYFRFYLFGIFLTGSITLSKISTNICLCFISFHLLLEKIDEKVFFIIFFKPLFSHFLCSEDAL